MNSKVIPLVDLKKQYQTLQLEIQDAMNQVIEQTAFVRGPFVSKFEKEYADLMGVKHCIGVANGTDALFVTLKMMGIGPGDEVITTASSWISTSETISLTGATPIFVDIDATTYTIDPGLIERSITKRTKAILPVHLYGQMADIDTIRQICDRHTLLLVEDCAQAHLAIRDGIVAGNAGDAATFSFYPGKNLGAFGDAGCVITNNDDLANKVRRYANHGAIVKHHHDVEGINSRLDGLQAAILSVKLPHLRDWTRRRRDVAATYDTLLDDIPNITTPTKVTNSQHAYHLYVIRCDRRDELREHLATNHISTGIHYPKPLPHLDAYAHISPQQKRVPVAEQASQEILSIPMYPEMTPSQISCVADSIRDFYTRCN